MLFDEINKDYTLNELKEKCISNPKLKEDTYNIGEYGNLLLFFIRKFYSKSFREDEETFNKFVYWFDNVNTLSEDTYCSELVISRFENMTDDEFYNIPENYVSSFIDDYNELKGINLWLHFDSFESHYSYNKKRKDLLRYYVKDVSRSLLIDFKNFLVSLFGNDEEDALFYYLDIDENIYNIINNFNPYLLNEFSTIKAYDYYLNPLAYDNFIKTYRKDMRIITGNIINYYKEDYVYNLSEPIKIFKFNKDKIKNLSEDMLLDMAEYDEIIPKFLSYELIKNSTLFKNKRDDFVVNCIENNKDSHIYFQLSLIRLNDFYNTEFESSIIFNEFLNFFKEHKNLRFLLDSILYYEGNLELVNEEKFNWFKRKFM